MPTTRDNFKQVLDHSNTCSRPPGPRITDMRCADIAWRAASPSLTTGAMTACGADLIPSQEA